MEEKYRVTENFDDIDLEVVSGVSDKGSVTISSAESFTTVIFSYTH